MLLQHRATVAAKLCHDEVDRYGRNRIIDDTLLTLMSAEPEELPFTLPPHSGGVDWELILDTRSPMGTPESPVTFRVADVYSLDEHSQALFRLRKEE